MCVAGIGLFACGQKTEAGEMPTAEQLKEYKEDGTLDQRIQYYKNAGGESYSDGLIQKKEAGSEIATYSNVPEEWGKYMPSEGDAKVLMLRVDFPDATFKEGDTEEALNNIAFGGDTEEGYTAYPYESLQAYYERSSYGKLHISGDTRSYTAQHERSYYEEQGIASLYKEVLDAIDPEVDFSQYDGNHDGYIDGLYLHFAGAEDSGWESIWWSQAYLSLLPDAEYDGMHVGGCVTLHYRSNSKDGVHILFHETGHLLGLPDYYNYGTKMYEDGLDAYDMMMDSIGDHNAFSKWLLGWIEDDEIKTITLDDKDAVSEDVTLESLSKEKQDGGQYKCAVIGLKNEGMFSEYLLVEYDTELENQTGLVYKNKELPDGFRVFHVNAELNSEKKFMYNNYDGAKDRLIELVDKDEEKDRNHIPNYNKDVSVTEVSGKGEEYGCKYLKGDLLTPDTVPSTDLLKGQFFHKSGISITGFEPEGDKGRISVNVKKVEPSQDDVKIKIGTKWRNLNQNNVILLPVTLKENADINQEKPPYLVDKAGNKITGELCEGTGKGNYFIVIHPDYLEAGEYECVLPEGAFNVDGIMESAEQKVSVHVSENMRLKTSGSLKVTNTIVYCKAEDSGWYVLEPREAGSTEGYLYKISEKGEVTEQKIDTKLWSTAKGFDSENMGIYDLKSLSDGTFVVIGESHNPDKVLLMHIDKTGKILDDVKTLQGRNWEIHTVGNTVKAMEKDEGESKFYSIEFGKEMKEPEFLSRAIYKFMKDGYIVSYSENKAAEDAKESDMWVRVEYRNEQDEIVDCWEYPYGESEGRINQSSTDGVAMNDDEVYLLELNLQDDDNEDDDYILSDIRLKVCAINRKNGKVREIKLKDEALRFGKINGANSKVEISDVSEQNGKILFSLNSSFCAGAGAVDDTYCLDLKDGTITKRIGLYSGATMLLGTKVMEIDWSEEYPRYLIYDAEDEPDTPNNPGTPDNPNPSDKPANPDKKGTTAVSTGTSTANKNVNKAANKTTTNKTGAQNSKKASTAKTGDTAPIGVYAILLCVSAGVVIAFVMKRRKK